MASLRLFEPALTDAFDTMLRRFVAPMRTDRTLDDLDIRVGVVEKEGMYKVRADRSSFWR